MEGGGTRPARSGSQGRQASATEANDSMMRVTMGKLMEPVSPVPQRRRFPRLYVRDYRALSSSHVHRGDPKCKNLNHDNQPPGKIVHIFAERV